MKTTEKRSSTKKNVSKKSIDKSILLSDKVLAYCGYKLVGNKLVSTGKYNPVPYEGL